MRDNKNVSRISRKSLNVEWKGIYIHINDHALLRMYRVKHKISLTAVLHMLIGTAGKCLEEKHSQRIAFLEKQVGHLAGIVIAYRDKYGKLPPVSGQAAANEGKYHV